MLSHWAFRVLDIVERIFMAGACCALVIMLFSVTADGMGRYLLNRPLHGNYEFTSMISMPLLVFLGLARTYALGGHIRLEIFRPQLRKVPWHLTERVNTLLAAIAFFLIAYYAGQDALAKIAARETTMGLVQLPVYLAYVWFPAGAGLLAVRLALETVVPQDREHHVEHEL